MTDTQSSGGLSVGDVVADRYRVEAILGEGGMGVVYRTEHLHLRKPFALKVLLPEWTSSTEIVARFEREAVAAGNIQSPHVAAATDFGRLPDGTFFLVMEYVEGRTLRSVLESGALEPARALHVARGIASGLHAAHLAGIVHRDMKPENVMLVERDGDADFAKILDFGIAKLEPVHIPSSGAASPLTRAGAVMGTPHYMSPEQAVGQPVDARSDLYSVGVIVFEMLTGVRPFEGDPIAVLGQHLMAPPPELPASLAGRVDPSVGDIVRRLLAKGPENRFSSAGELVDALDACSRRTEALAGTPPPRDSTGAVSTPIVKRVARSLLTHLNAVGMEARLVLANPRAVLERPKRRVLVTAIVGVSIVVGLLTMLVARSGAPPEHARPAAAPAAQVTTVSGAPSSAPTVVPGGMADLPPPPSPSSSTSGTSGRPAPSGSGQHRTGPGGIYIPPPSTWFR